MSEQDRYEAKAREILDWLLREYGMSSESKKLGKFVSEFAEKLRQHFPLANDK